MRFRLRRKGDIEDRLVWIFGSPRSGSTWLLFTLAEHEDVVAVNEPNLGWYLGAFLSDLPGFGSTGLDSTNCTLRQVQDDHSVQFFAREFTDSWQPPFAAMIRDRFAAHVERYPPKSGNRRRALVLIKEPNGSQSADMIMRAVPRAQLLFLLRDGRDVVDSDLAGHLKGAWVTTEFPGAEGITTDEERLAFVAQSARKWVWRTEIVQRAYADHPGPKRLVKYEDLLGDPGRHLRSLVDWLGLDAGDDQLDAMIVKHAFENVAAESRGPTGFFRAARPGLWRENLSAAEQSVLLEILGAKVEELGYPAPPGGAPHRAVGPG